MHDGKIQRSGELGAVLKHDRKIQRSGELGMVENNNGRLGTRRKILTQCENSA
jgi:hypothetical protein